MVSMAVAFLGLLVVFVMGLVDPFINDDIEGSLITFIIPVLVIGAFLAARFSDNRALAASVGATMGFLTLLLFLEGRYTHYVAGWEGRHISQFISALGEMGTTASSAQEFVLFLGGMGGIPLALVGALVGWFATPRKGGSDTPSHVSN
jgi:hypothetical protein